MKIEICRPFFFLMLFSFFSASSFAEEPKINGKEVFRNKCRACHSVTEKRKIGPGLSGISKRTDVEWLNTWLTEPQKTWKKNEGYTETLRKSVRKGETREITLMQYKLVGKKPTEEEIKAVIEYINTLP